MKDFEREWYAFRDELRKQLPIGKTRKNNPDDLPRNVLGYELNYSGIIRSHIYAGDVKGIYSKNGVIVYVSYAYWMDDPIIRFNLDGDYVLAFLGIRTNPEKIQNDDTTIAPEEGEYGYMWGSSAKDTEW